MSEIDIYKNIGQQMMSDREKIKELEAEIQELNDSITWWTNRYNAVVKMNDDNVKTINKGIEFIEEMSDETEDMGIYDISYKNKAFLLRWFKGEIKR